MDAQEVLIPTAAAAVTAGALFGLSRRLGLGPKRSVTAGAAGGALAALIAVEHTSDGAGPWWAEHPSTGAALTGALLLALTVLIVEAAVERALDAADERRWARAGRASCETLLTTAETRMGDLWLIIFSAGSPVMGEHYSREANEAAQTFAEDFRAAVIASAPVLTRTDGLNAIYTHALDVADAASALHVRVSAWGGAAYAAEKSDDEGRPGAEALVEVAREAWNEVSASWAQACERMLTFEEATRTLGATAPQPSLAGSLVWHDRALQRL